jgi:hypothetical protein
MQIWQAGIAGIQPAAIRRPVRSGRFTVVLLFFLLNRLLRTPDPAHQIGSEGVEVPHIQSQDLISSGLSCRCQMHRVIDSASANADALAVFEHLHDLFRTQGDDVHPFRNIRFQQGCRRPGGDLDGKATSSKNRKTFRQSVSEHDPIVRIGDDPGTRGVMFFVCNERSDENRCVKKLLHREHDALPGFSTLS